MKIRNGFVSNSSSSSFILPVESNEIGEVTITLSIEDLVKYIVNQSNNDDETGIDHIIVNVDELNNYFIDQYDLDPDFFENINSPDYVPGERDYVEQEYLISVKFLKEGKHIIFGSVSYNDYFLSQFLQKMGAKIDN